MSATAVRAETPVAMLATAPVSLSSCDVGARASSPRMVDSFVPAIVTSVGLRFRNLRPIDATEVDVQVGYDGETSNLIDKGRFSQATAIAHEFTAFAGNAYASTATDLCRVIAVRYADGSIWQAAAGSPLAAAPRRAP